MIVLSLHYCHGPMCSLQCQVGKKQRELVLGQMLDTCIALEPSQPLEESPLLPHFAVEEAKTHGY